MKKLLLIALFALGFTTMNAQIIRDEDLEEYAKEKYGEKWVEAAENIAKGIELDKNKAITFVQVIEAEGKSASDLYVLMNYWFTMSFNDANNVIKLNDKEVGTIIGEGYISNITEKVGATNSYAISIKPIIKCDIKEGKVRITYTIPYYMSYTIVGGGWMGVASGSAKSAHEEKFLLDKTYPFAEKDSHKKLSCKALVMANAYSNVVLDKIEEAIKSGLIGNEGDDW